MRNGAVFLLVENSDDDVFLIRKAFRRAAVYNALQVVPTGSEAVAYLNGDGRYANREEFPLPSLVLLDLHLPDLDGIEVLEWIRQQPELRLLRVVVLTSAASINDVNLAYQCGANSFLIKPVEFNQLVQTSLALKAYWVDIDRTPSYAP